MSDARPPAAKPVITRSRAVWRGNRQFDAGPEGRTHLIDGSAKVAPGPLETLLNAIATCSAVDVLDILEKRRTPVERLTIELVAHRRPEQPRRVMRLEIQFRISGAGIDHAHAQRAVDLSIEKYCSVAASLAPDLAIEASVLLE